MVVSPPPPDPANVGVLRMKTENEAMTWWNPVEGTLSLLRSLGRAFLLSPLRQRPAALADAGRVLFTRILGWPETQYPHALPPRWAPWVLDTHASLWASPTPGRKPILI